LVSDSFQIIPRLVGLLGLGLGPHIVGQLGSRVCRLADDGGRRG